MTGELDFRLRPLAYECQASWWRQWPDPYVLSPVAASASASSRVEHWSSGRTLCLGLAHCGRDVTRAACKVCEGLVARVRRLGAVSEFDTKAEHRVGNLRCRFSSHTPESATLEQQWIEVVDHVAGHRDKVELEAQRVCAHAAYTHRHLRSTSKHELKGRYPRQDATRCAKPRRQ